MLAAIINIPAGNCIQAHELYKKAFGMVVYGVTYNDEAPTDYHDESLTDTTRKLVLHSECSLYGTRSGVLDIHVLHSNRPIRRQMAHHG